jgi:hypothetical protein
LSQKCIPYLKQAKNPHILVSIFIEHSNILLEHVSAAFDGVDLVRQSHCLHYCEGLYHLNNALKLVFSTECRCVCSECRKN